jgi:hypothetical protein
MKKIILAVVLLFALMGVVYADPPSCVSSGLKTSDAQIMTRDGDSWRYLCGVELIPGASADATLILYDNTSAAGDVLVSLKADMGNAIAGFAPTAFSILVYTGIYADVGGADAGYIIWYRE